MANIEIVDEFGDHPRVVYRDPLLREGQEPDITLQLSIDGLYFITAELPQSDGFTAELQEVENRFDDIGLTGANA
jgi:hypothetical protein